jgi:hypothetical protein
MARGASSMPYILHVCAEERFEIVDYRLKSPCEILNLLARIFSCTRQSAGTFRGALCGGGWFLRFARSQTDATADPLDVVTVRNSEEVHPFFIWL